MKPIYNRLQECGATLIEVVLAILLTASCVIGIAAIYAGQQNTARGGRLHSDAVTLAQQMAQHIQSANNPGNEFETTLGVTCENPKQAITPRQFVACWQTAVAEQLTNGVGYIELDKDADPAQFVIVVSWSEPRTGTASYVLRVSQTDSSESAKS